MRRISLVFTVLSVLFFSCTEESGTVNRVQPNAVEKAVFEGDWHYLQTVIDTPYSTAFTFVGEQSPLNKIHWEITEDYLIARRSYDFIANSEGTGIRGEADQGAPIAIYAIKSHFNIRREYNTTTGEEYNVVVENDQDGAWYERPFMRVDWSSNLVTDTELFIWARIFNNIQLEPVSYYVQAPSADAPKFEANADGEVQYIDIVNKAFVQPESVNLEGYGPIPVCWFSGNEHLDCGGSEITVRHSFRKVDPRHDYQPADYSGDRMDKFGYFINVRAGYDEQYGTVEPSRYHFINRHNLWVSSHKRTSNGEFASCTTDAECEDGRGSVCDMDLAKAQRTERGACTIPYRDRAVQAIAYHASKSFPEDMIPDAKFVVSDWNKAMGDTIDSLREQECLTHGGDALICAAERDHDDSDQAVVFCHSPVLASDSERCGGEGTVAEIGDLRYSLLGWVNEPNVASPLGYGPSAADPETGEIIQANAFIYGAEVEWLGAYARDLVALLNGDLDESDLTDGSYVEDWVNAGRVPGDTNRDALRAADLGTRWHAVPLDGNDASDVADAMNFDWAKPRGRFNRKPANGAEMRERMLGAARRLEHEHVLVPSAERAYGKLESFKGTALERSMVTKEMLLASGIDPRTPVTDEVLDQASPLRRSPIAKARALAAIQRKMNAEACILRREFADDGLMGLAQSIRQAAVEGDGTMEWYGVTYNLRKEGGGIDYDAVRRALRHPILQGTLAHEVGHTVGLRHNFSGSADSLNYGPEYWDLREDGATAPRAWDPLSNEEITGRIREHQTSSVMDYGNNFVVTDSAGLGHYDRAAIKMGYGDLVEVFTQASDARDIAWVGVAHSYGWSMNIKESSFNDGSEITAYPYTELPSLVGGEEGLEARADVPYTTLRPHVGLARDGIEERVVDTAGRPMVPYFFCSDEQSDLFPECMLYDAGADAYEQVQSVIDMYWNYYKFSAFRRERLDFNIEAYYDRVLWRYLIKLEQANQSFALDRVFFEDVFAGDPSLESLWSRQDGMGAWTLAVGSAFDILHRVIMTPEPGPYAERTRADGSLALMMDDRTENPDVTLALGEGRYLDTTWNFDAGYYWFDQLERAGFFYDKVIALLVLTDPETNFVGKDTSSDVRGYQLSFYTTFREALTKAMTGTLSEDWSAIAARASEDGTLTYPSVSDLAAGLEPEGAPVDPNAAFTIQLYAALYSMALVPATFENDYLNRARIFVRGGAEGVTIDSSVPVVEFLDPRSGLTYVAASYLDTEGQETGLGAKMLLHARALQEQSATQDLDLYLDNLDVMRQLTWYLGFGTAI